MIEKMFFGVFTFTRGKIAINSMPSKNIQRGVAAASDVYKRQRKNKVKISFLDIKSKKKMVVDRKNVFWSIYLYKGEDCHKKHAKQEHPKGSRSSFISTSSRWRRFRGGITGTHRERWPGRTAGNTRFSFGDLLLERSFRLGGVEV